MAVLTYRYLRMGYVSGIDVWCFEIICYPEELVPERQKISILPLRLVAEGLSIHATMKILALSLCYFATAIDLTLKSNEFRN